MAARTMSACWAHGDVGPMMDGVELIAANHVAGATALAREVGDLVAQTLRRSPGTVTETVLACVRAQPAMAPIARFASDVLVAWDQEGTTGVEGVIRRLPSRQARALRSLVEAAGPHVAPGVHILTHSASSAVSAVLLAAHEHGVPFRVTCLEARPLGEGRDLAQQLAAAGIRVRLVVDAAMGLAVGDADIVLLGADTITAGALIHKIGTWPLCLAASELGVPCYALATSDKLLPALIRGALDQERPAAEVHDAPLPGLTVSNRGFDLTPLELLDRVFVGGVVLTPDQASRRAARVGLHPLVAAELEEAED